jgi:hypothetical protein
MRFVNVLAIGFVICLAGTRNACHAQGLQSGSVIDSALGRGFYITHTNDPTQNNFNAARGEYLDFDFAASAASIRRGAERLREALDDAADSSRQALQDSAKELEALANAIEQRSVDNVKRLDEAFARANYALAQRHYFSALQAREQMAQARVGEELHRSAEYLQRARQQIGLQLQDNEAAVIDRTRTLGSKLAAGFNATSDEVTNQLQSFGQGLVSLRDRFGGRTTANGQPIQR